MKGKNPFLPRTARKMTVASELRHGRGGERIVGHNGEINAGSKGELMKQIAHLMSLASTNNLVTDDQAVQAEAAAKRREEVRAAFASTARHKELGESVADELYITQNREGIMRSVLNRMELNDGEIPVIKLRNRNITATFATSPASCETQLVRDNFLCVLF